MTTLKTAPRFFCPSCFKTIDARVFLKDNGEDGYYEINCDCGFEGKIGIGDYEKILNEVDKNKIALCRNGGR